jgi:hypothetical protein
MVGISIVTGDSTQNRPNVEGSLTVEGWRLSSQADMSSLSASDTCGKDFFAVMGSTQENAHQGNRAGERPLYVYRLGPSGWFVDTTFRSTCGNWSDNTQICAVGDDFVYISTLQGDCVMKRTATGWIAFRNVDTVLANAGGTNAYGGAFPVGVGPNYVVVRHNFREGYRGSNWNYLWDLAVVRILPYGIQVDTIGTGYTYTTCGNYVVPVPIMATCGLHGESQE